MSAVNVTSAPLDALSCRVARSSAAVSGSSRPLTTTRCDRRPTFWCTAPSRPATRCSAKPCWVSWRSHCTAVSWRSSTIGVVTSHLDAEVVGRHGELVGKAGGHGVDQLVEPGVVVVDLGAGRRA